MLEVFSFFPTLVYRNELPGWVKDVDKYTQKYFEDVKEKNEEYEKSECVVQTYNMVDDLNLAFVKNYFLQESKYILSEQGYLIDNYNLYVQDMWGQEFRQTGFNWPHVHSNCHISGLYFFNVPEDTSELMFGDPRPGKLMSDLDHKNCPDTLYPATPSITLNKIKTGTFVLFNAWLTHNLTLSNTDRPLKFLHFNLACEKKR